MDGVPPDQTCGYLRALIFPLALMPKPGYVSCVFRDGPLDGEEAELPKVHCRQELASELGSWIIEHEDGSASIMKGDRDDRWTRYVQVIYKKQGKDERKRTVYAVDRHEEVVRCAATNQSNGRRCKNAAETAGLCKTHARARG